MSVDKLISRLDKAKQCAGKHARQWNACCPSHDDSSPSLRVSETHEGNVLIHCYAGCLAPDVLDAVGLDWKDILPAHFMNKPERRPPYQKTEIDRQIERVIGYLSAVDHERLVIDIYRLMRRNGVPVSRDDRDRVRQAMKACAERGIQI